MIDKNKMKKRFSRNAKNYDKYANVQKYMADELINLLKNRSFKNILEIGSGTGYLTKKLLIQYPEANIEAIDIASGMIQISKINVKSGNVNFKCCDFEEYDDFGNYDLIISNATFQWFNYYNNSMKKIKELLKSDGVFCFSTFGSDTFRELHETYNNIQYTSKNTIKPGQEFLNLVEFENSIELVFNNNIIRTFDRIYIEYFDDCLDFFYSIKKIGANNSQTSKKPQNSDFIFEVVDYYNQNYIYKDQVYATYHGLFGLIEL